MTLVLTSACAPVSDDARIRSSGVQEIQIETTGVWLEPAEILSITSDNRFAINQSRGFANPTVFKSVADELFLVKYRGTSNMPTKSRARPAIRCGTEWYDSDDTVIRWKTVNAGGHVQVVESSYYQGCAGSQAKALLARINAARETILALK